MSTSNMARYSLAHDGAVRHWLARGAFVTPLTALEQVISPTADPFEPDGRAWITNAPYSLHLKQTIYNELPMPNWAPDRRPHHELPSDFGNWEYRRLDDDNTVDFNRFNFTPVQMQGWAYTGLEIESERSIRARLLDLGLTQVWLNGENTGVVDSEVGYVHPLYHEITLNLRAGLNDLYLYGVMIGWREARIALGIQFIDLPLNGVTICIPISNVPPERWHAAENALDNVLIKQFAFPRLPALMTFDATATTPVTLIAEITMPSPELVVKRPVNMQLPVGHAMLTLQPGQTAELPITNALLDAMSSLPGENHLELTIKPADGTPLATKRALWASRQLFSDHTYGTYDSRKREALEHVAQMPFDVLGTMCAVMLGQAELIDATGIQIACEFMQDRRDCADFYAVSLIALMYKYGRSSVLRPAERTRIENAFKTFKYWIEEPGVDAMCYFTENHQILFHVTAYLAAQYWHDWAFDNSQFYAADLKARAKTDIQAWISRRLRGSFSEWDSNAYMALDAFALLVLNEFSDDPALNAAATTLLDKIFFLIACQSFKGAHGSTHGRCYVAGLKSSRFENTSALQRIAWGMGIFNGETRTTGMLALAEKYHVPDIIQQIGAHMPDLLVTRARSVGDYRLRHDLREDGWDAKTITRRTPDYMLSACVDHRLNEVGIQEHLWQATFSPEAVIFTNYPGNSQEHGNARPNFWAGSVRLPRVAMHERTVICLYPLQPDIGLGFSHAYFPTAHFDAWELEGQWAFARFGDAYAALWSDGELSLTSHGLHAAQELRSAGGGHAWLSHVGSRAENGDFASFIAKAKTNKPQLAFINDGIVPTITCSDINGTVLRFGETGGLWVNDVEYGFEDFPHYDNEYTHTPMNADTMTITHGDRTLTLDLNL